MSIKYKGQTIANVGGGSTGVTMDQVNTAIDEKLSDFQPLETYSTEERRIGTWVNGKPLYRRAISGSYVSSAGDETTYILTDDTIEIASLSGMLKSPTSYSIPWETAFPAAFKSGNNINIISLMYNPKTKAVGIRSGYAQVATFSYVVNIEYTKITDNPTTTYSTQSVPLINTTAVSVGGEVM